MQNHQQLTFFGPPVALYGDTTEMSTTTKVLLMGGIGAAALYLLYRLAKGT